MIVKIAGQKITLEFNERESANQYERLAICQFFFSEPRHPRCFRYSVLIGLLNNILIPA